MARGNPQFRSTRTGAKVVSMKRKRPRQKGSASGRWSSRKLPEESQRELDDRVRESERGKTLIAADDAMAEAERMADEVAEILGEEPRPRE